MKPGDLVRNSVKYYWRTNVAVVLGVATAVAVLAGALLVGDSVRGSLRDLVLQRLGETDLVIASAGFVREQLAADLRAHPDFSNSFAAICPVVIVQGFVSVQSGGGRAGEVAVYGVDERFWRFHGISAVSGLEGREALLSPALAEELGAQAGTVILVRVERPSDVPLESLHGRKDDLGSTIRATVRATIPREAMGDFSLQAQQGSVRAVFLPLALMQRELEVGGRVNTLLVSTTSGDRAATTAALERMVDSAASLPDFGLNLRVIDARGSLALEAEGGLVTDAEAAAAIAAAREAGLQPEPVFTYLANSLRSGGREVPYSLVAAVDLPMLAAGAAASEPPPILLNDWAARDLRVAAGDVLTMEYYVWEEPGRLLTRTTEFRIAGVIPLDTRDRDLAPVYPGISDSPSLEDWDPPFPIDLRRIRRIDEEYWNQHRTTPKAYIPFAVGRELWQSRHGSMTSIRFTPEGSESLAEAENAFVGRLRAKLTAQAMGLAVRDARAEGLRTSQGSTDFGEYFVYFSFFLVVSALLLSALFFKLSVEQRAREVGLLRATGFGARLVRRLFMQEALLLSAIGAITGVLGALGYSYLMMAGLRTWWAGAVGTTTLVLHVSAAPLAAGALGGMAAAMACIWATLRNLDRISERSLLTDQISSDTLASAPVSRTGGRSMASPAVLLMLGGALIAAGATGVIAEAAAFFGAGAALLAAAHLLFYRRLARPSRTLLQGQGWASVARLGLRNAAYRPARSVLSMAMIAAATFILISVDAFRKPDGSVKAGRQTGLGGYALLVKSLLPVAHDPGRAEGRAALGLTGSEFDAVRIEPFRVRPGDDTSCLNLYAPENPRILAPRDSFLEEGRFRFRSSLASSDAERANPWLLLHRDEADDVVPVIADANSMNYALHRKLGEEMVITQAGRPIRLRLVAALDDSIFQGELLMSQANFLKLFPERQGYQFFLAETPPEHRESAALAIEDALAGFGADVRGTAERLAEFHQVENTYLSTFQLLGGLGLLLGTIGLGAVLVRNVLERRRELALLRALGYRQAHLFTMTIAEHALLLAGGLLTGALCALLAIAPVLLEQSGGLPVRSLSLLLGGVLAAGLITSLAATAVALRASLLDALRSA